MTITSLASVADHHLRRSMANVSLVLHGHARLRRRLYEYVLPRLAALIVDPWLERETR